jgi:hypothetical protein
MTLSMLLSAQQQQHYPRKGTCTRHGNLRPIIPVTSRRRRKSGDEKPCGILTCDLACTAKLSLTHGPRVDRSTSAGGIRSSTQEYNRALLGGCYKRSVDGVQNKTAVFVDVPLYMTAVCRIAAQRLEGYPRSVVAPLLLCLLDGSSGPGDAHPTDYSARACGDGKSKLLLRSSSLVSKPPTLFRGSIWFVRTQASKAHVQRVT